MPSSKIYRRESKQISDVCGLVSFDLRKMQTHSSWGCISKFILYTSFQLFLAWLVCDRKLFSWNFHLADLLNHLFMRWQHNTILWILLLVNYVFGSFWNDFFRLHIRYTIVYCWRYPTFWKNCSRLVKGVILPNAPSTSKNTVTVDS